MASDDEQIIKPSKARPKKTVPKKVTVKKSASSKKSAPSKKTAPKKAPASAKPPVPDPLAVEETVYKELGFQKPLWLSFKWPQMTAEKKSMAAAALILVLTLVVSTWIYNSTKDTPSDVLMKFYTSYASGRFDGSYRLLPRKFQKKYTLEQFGLFGRSVRKMGLKFKDANVTHVAIDDNKATINYNLKVSGGSHGKGWLNFKGIAILGKESGHWVVKQAAGLPSDWLKDPKNIE